jgi:hypothetical protein
MQKRYDCACGYEQAADCRQQMQTQLPPGITLVQADDFQTWLMDIQVIDSNPIYAGETYRLKFTFSPQYPIEVRLFPILPPPPPPPPTFY